MKGRQKYIIGSVFKIPLNNNKICFGRLITGIRTAIYDLCISQTTIIPDFEFIVKQRILFYVCVYRTVITKGEFEVIGLMKPSQEDIENVPPTFNQDLMNIDDCTISYADDRLPEYKASAIDCIGLERSSVYGYDNVVERIEDFYAGKKNFHVEFSKVILSTEDIRYNPAGLLRWDKQKEVFFKTLV